MSYGIRIRIEAIDITRTKMYEVEVKSLEPWNGRDNAVAHAKMILESVLPLVGSITLDVDVIEWSRELDED